MSGLLRRIRTARRAAPDQSPPDDATWPDGGAQARAQAGPDDGARHPAVPAGTDLDALVGDRPTTQRRSRMRRRLRHLRRVREVLLRDLGGLVFEIHRSGKAGSEEQSRLVGGKLARLDAVNAEIRELADVLDDHRGMVLREPGIGGTCPLCGELHGSDARFCWACGSPVAPGAARPVTASGAQALPAIAAAVPAPPEPAPEPAPAPHADADTDAEELHAPQERPA